jgi:ribosomal protein L32
VPDKFISHAKRNEQLAECGLTVEHIVEMCNI